MWKDWLKQCRIFLMAFSGFGGRRMKTAVLAMSSPRFRGFLRRGRIFQVLKTSSTLISYERSDKYQVSNVLDHDLSTAWVEGVDGYGEVRA